MSSTQYSISIVNFHCLFRILATNTNSKVYHGCSYFFQLHILGKENHLSVCACNTMINPSLSKGASEDVGLLIYENIA